MLAYWMRAIVCVGGGGGGIAWEDVGDRDAVWLCFTFWLLVRTVGAY